MGRGVNSLRVRSIASAWFSVLVVACVALAAVGGFAAYTAHADPGTTSQQSERAHWSVDGDFGHSAEVTRENPVFDVGDTLSNRSTYFTNAAPVLDARYAATYTGAGADSATVTVNATLVARSSGENTVYWTDRRQLDDATASVEPGESTAVEFSLNATEVAQWTSEISSELGSTPGEVETFVAVAVDAEGTADGRPASLSLSHRLPLSVDGDTYTVGPAETSRETVTTTGTVTTTREYGPLWSVGGPLLFLLGGSGLVGLLAGRWRDEFELSAAERRYLEFLDERAEFDEWVVSMRLPAELYDRPRADAESLSDVVNFAIDTDSGVVEDPDTGTFYAVGEELLVAYDPPTPPAESAVDDGGDSSSLFEPATATDGVSDRADGESDGAAGVDADQSSDATDEDVEAANPDWEVASSSSDEAVESTGQDEDVESASPDGGTEDDSSTSGSRE